MSADLVESIRRIVDDGDDADASLRAVVHTIASSESATWAAVAFAENGALSVGPSAGREDDVRRTRTPITFDGSAVGELWVDGEIAAERLRSIAEILAPYVLIGWDTSGEAWEP